MNGTENHVHSLFLHNKNLAFSKMVRELKKSSSKWIKSQPPLFRRFAWQEGYGAFSVSESSAEAVRAYIRKQKERHRKITFEYEFLQLLQRHHVSYDPRYIWD